jgi:hypothetical protein
LAVTGTPQKSAGEVKSDLNAALYLPGSVRWLSVAVPAVDSAGMAAGGSINVGPVAVVPISIAVGPIAVVPIVPIAAVAIISVAIISMAICTPMMSAVDASNAPGC